MIRVVIDTSVLVSAVISPTGPNAQLFDFIAAKEIRPYITDAMLEEYYQVFEYEHLQHFSKRRVAQLRGLLEDVAVKVKSRGRLKISTTKTTTESMSARSPPRPTTLSLRIRGTSGSPTKSQELLPPGSF